MADDVDLFAALRSELDGAMLKVAWSDIASCAAVAADCLPWPWAICGTDDGPGPEALARFLSKPVIWFWLGAAPAWLPHHRRAHQRWRDVLADVAGCLHRSVGGLQLAPNRGVIGPGRVLLLSPGLEALVASSPAPVAMPARAAGPVKRLLERHRLPLALVKAGSGMRIAEAA